jgi:catechol 2,3-dioxygenase-like lactoylglutathione lyase family enzyme
VFLNHFQIECADFGRSAAFYDAVLATLGASRQEDFSPEAIGYGTDMGPEFWIGGNFPGAKSGRPCHLAFNAPNCEQVEAFVAAARDLGYEVLHEPREWPEYMDSYYAGFVRDPDGNNVEAVHLDWTKLPKASETS